MITCWLQCFQRPETEQLFSALLLLQTNLEGPIVPPSSFAILRAKKSVLLQPRWAPCSADTVQRLCLRAMMSASDAADAREWRSLAMPKEELCLAFTLPTGQSFRWRKTGDDVYTGVVHKRVVSLASLSGMSSSGKGLGYLTHGDSMTKQYLCDQSSLLAMPCC